MYRSAIGVAAAVVVTEVLGEVAVADVDDVVAGGGGVEGLGRDERDEDEEEEEEDDDDEDKPKPAERRRKREAEEEKEKKAEDKVIVRNAGKSLEEIRAELEDISKKHWKKIGSDFDLKFQRLNLVNATKGLYQKQTPLSQIRLDFAEFVHNVTGKEWDGLADDDEDKMCGGAEDGEEDEGDYEFSSSSSSEEEGQNKKAKKDGNK